MTLHNSMQQWCFPSFMSCNFDGQCWAQIPQVIRKVWCNRPLLGIHQDWKLYQTLTITRAREKSWHRLVHASRPPCSMLLPTEAEGSETWCSGCEDAHHEPSSGPSGDVPYCPGTTITKCKCFLTETCTVFVYPWDIEVRSLFEFDKGKGILGSIKRCFWWWAAGS